MKPGRSPRPAERTDAPFPSRGKRWRARFEAFHLRDVWWSLLDYFEASRWRRVALGAAAAGVLLTGAGWYWAYPWWTRHTAISVAQKWLEAGQLRYAAEAAEKAARVAPDRPEPWAIAAELARRGGQFEQALTYARKAAELAPADSALHISWASSALLANNLPEAATALERVAPGDLTASALAQRIQGELARRQFKLTAAREFFDAALKLEGPQAVNEVPLGLILLQATDPAERQKGLGLLAKWTTDPEWGATALRTLLTDAQEHSDRAAMARWAEALRIQPNRTNADMRQCLQALALADESKFQAMLAGLEKDHAASPAAAVQLLSWLNQIGRGTEAVRWMQTLPEADLHRPPLIVAAAEALRIAADWTTLKGWTETGDWGRDTDFLRWVYALQAAQMLKDEPRAEELHRSLLSRAQVNGVHGQFAASSLYAWGRQDEALALWWKVSEQEGQIALDALGSLARHYQVARDADGQYRIFRRLYSLRPEDRAVRNNFAFFATLLGREQRTAARLARENLELEPMNMAFLATHAFVLLQEGRTTDALALLKPRANDVARVPALGFAYGLALSATGRKAAAHTLLDKLPADTLTGAEVELIRKSLAD